MILITNFQHNNIYMFSWCQEPEDEDVDRARDLLLQPATEEHNKGEHRDLFFFIGADVRKSLKTKYQVELF